MTIRAREILRGFFKPRAVPTAEQFGDLIDSAVHHEEDADKLLDDGRREKLAAAITSVADTAKGESPLVNLVKIPQSEHDARIAAGDPMDDKTYLITRG